MTSFKNKSLEPISTCCGDLNVQIGRNGTGIKLLQFFVGRNGFCARTHMDVNSSLATLALEKGATIDEVIEILKGQGCDNADNRTKDKKSCYHTTALAIESEK